MWKYDYLMTVKMNVRLYWEKIKIVATQLMEIQVQFYRFKLKFVN